MTDRITHCQHCQEDFQCVRRVPIFSDLSEQQINEIMNLIEPITLQKGEYLYQAGDITSALYVVDEGRIRITRIAESGKQQLIRILKSGEFTGELALFQETIHDSYAEALEDTEICMIKQADFTALLEKYPRIAVKVLAEFALRLKVAEKQATAVAIESVETRLAQYLVEISDLNQTKESLKLPMSKKDLASYLGTTPETLSRKLTAFEDEGIIKQAGQRVIMITDYQKLLIK